MPNATAPVPPPAIVHAAQRRCTSQLLALPPDERAKGAWVGYPSGAWNIVVHCRQDPESTVITQDIQSHYIPNPSGNTKYERRQNSAFIRILPVVLLLVIAIVAEANPRNSTSPPSVSQNPQAAHISLLHARIGP